MKKTLAGVFATLLCLGCFTGCSVDTVKDKFGDLLEKIGLKEKVETDVKGAADFLYDIYVEKNATTTRDYTVPTTFQYLGVTYSVAWSSNAADVKVEKGNDAEMIVNVNELVAADVNYTLTATLSYEDEEETAEAKLERTLKALSSQVAAPITAAPVAGTAYKFNVYQGANMQSVYLNGKMKNTYYFDTTEDTASAIDLYVEEATGGFYLYFNEVAGETTTKKYINTREVDGNDGNKHVNSFYEEEAKTVYTYDETLGTIVTKVNNKTYYFGCDGTYNTVEPQSESGEGYYKGYLVSMVDRSTVPVEDKLYQTVKEIGVKPEVFGESSVTLEAIGITFPEVSMTYSVSGDGAAIVDGLLTDTLTLKAGAEDSKVTLTVELVCGEAKETATYEIDLIAPVDLPDDGSTLTIPEVLALTIKLPSDQKATTEKYYVEGTVTEVKSTTYGNLYIQDADGNQLYVYGCYDKDGNRYDAMETYPVVGSKVKFYSSVSVYKGVNQLYNATIETMEGGETKPEVTLPADGSTLTIAEVLALPVTSDTTEKYYTVGTIKNVYDTTWGNMYIVDENGNELCVYGTYSADGETRYDAMETKPVAGDTVKVYGILSYYKAIQYKNAWIVEHTPAVKEEAFPVITADFDTQVANPATKDDGNAVADNSYWTRNTTAGWVIANAAAQIGSSSSYTFLEDTDAAIVLNGKTSAAGSLTSPVLSGGIKNLAFNYGFAFGDTQFSLSISVKNEAGTVVASTTLDKEGLTKATPYSYSWVLETPVEGNFTLEIVNTCKSAASGNKDRLAIWDLVLNGEITEDSGNNENENEDETPVAPTTLTIAAAVEKGLSYEQDNFSTEKYIISGMITEIKSTKYGNMYITDAAGNKIYLYGLYSADGATRYDAMTVQPQVGDYITVLGVVGNYNGAQVKSAWMTAHNQSLTIAAAAEKGLTYEQDNFSAEKYTITGTISEIKSTKYGNMYITDADGNEIYLYGLYTEDGATRYDSMTTKPAVGDTITVLGVVGNYNGAQVKSAWLIAHTVAVSE